jgi:serine/threonine protein kinase
MTTHQPGSEIAGYRIESLIGRGGMAVVYRAEDLRLGRKVALKLLPPQLADSEQFRQRFMRESRLAASLDHPNIVPIYEAGEADGQLFIAMRYVLGKDLKGLLADNGGQLAPSTTLRLFAQIGDALDAAHRAGLVHRDVKPANILITAGREQTRSPHSDHVYLTDFGLTKRTAELSGGLTGTGHFLGTVDYVAPEQIQGRPVGPGTDIYALGCVLYECLTGQLPFRRDEDAALLWAHLVEPPPPVTAIRAELPAAVNAVVTRAMAKDPADRYESCEELLGEFELALSLPAPVSSPLGRPTSGSRGGPRPSDGLPGNAWTEPPTVTGNLPGRSEHPSFPSQPLPPFRVDVPQENSSTADHRSDLADGAGRGWDDGDRGWDEDAGRDWDENGNRGWDDAGRHWDGDAGREWDGDAGRGWDEDEDHGWSDSGGPDRGHDDHAAPPTQPPWRRHWKLVALVAAAAVLVAVAAVVLRSVLGSEDYLRFTSNETVVPFHLDHPASWGSVVSPASDIVLGPDPTAADDVFFLKGTPEAWASATAAVRAGSDEDVWLYVNSPATTPDRSSVDALQNSIAPLLPAGTRFESTEREVPVAGTTAEEMEAVVSDPANAQTSLRLLVDVVQPPPGVDGAVVLAFAAPPNTFEDHRATFEKVRDSLQVTR